MVLIAAVGIGLTGCFHTGPKRIEAKQATTHLMLLTAGEGGDGILANKKPPPPAEPGEDKVELLPAVSSLLTDVDVRLKEINVARACGAKIPPTSGVQPLIAPIFAGAVLWGIEQGIGFVVDKIDSRLQKEIAEYTGTFDANWSGEFYAESNATPTTQLQCFRLSRGYKKDEKDKKKDKEDRLAMDFVGLLRINGQRLEIQPLRLYYENPLANTDSDEAYGVAIKLKMDAIWMDEHRGRREAGVIDASIVSEKVVLKLDKEDVKNTKDAKAPCTKEGTNGPYYYKYYGAIDGTCTKGELKDQIVYAPLPPWSRYPGQAYGKNWITATTTVGEVGAVPKFLKKLAEVFHDNKDDIEETLQDAAKKATGLDEDNEGS
jgi:hypothetical protein